MPLLVQVLGSQTMEVLLRGIVVAVTVLFDIGHGGRLTHALARFSVQAL
jgi:hypothetical protein